MSTYLSDLYNNLLVATSEHEVFSLQVMISLAYLLAFMSSMYRAHKDKELFSDFLSISVVVTKYMLTTLLMEHVLMYVSETGRSDIAQNIYLALSSASVLSMFVLYYLHNRFSYQYGNLFFCVMKQSALLAAAHFVIWVKFIVLNVQLGHAYLHYIYSFTVLYISVALAIAMLFPDVLRTRIGCIIGLYLPRGRDD